MSRILIPSSMLTPNFSVKKLPLNKIRAKIELNLRTNRMTQITAKAVIQSKRLKKGFRNMKMLSILPKTREKNETGALEYLSFDCRLFIAIIIVDAYLYYALSRYQ